MGFYSFEIRMNNKDNEFHVQSNNSWTYFPKQKWRLLHRVVLVWGFAE